MVLEAKNGNIIIKASNGKIRMEATDIEMVTTGDGGGKGNIKINSGNDIIIHAEKKYLVTSGSYIKMASSGDFECAANSVMSIYGSLFNAITDAVKKKPAKNGGQQELEKNNEV